jgi:hypothetical protein
MILEDMLSDVVLNLKMEDCSDLVYGVLAPPCLVRWTFGIFDGAADRGDLISLFCIVMYARGVGCSR